MGKLRRGSRLTSLPSRDWNRFVDTADHVLDRGFAHEGPQRPLMFGQVLVKNNSGADIDAHHILGIDGFDASAVPENNLDGFRYGDYLLDGVATVLADHIDRWAVTVEAIPDGEIGICQYTGTIVVKTTATAEVTEPYVTVKTADQKAEPAAFGRGRILMGDVISSEYWALVNLSNIGSGDIQFGQPASQHPSGDIRNYNLYEANSDDDGWTALGTTQANVFQRSLKSYDTGVMCVIWPMPGAGVSRHYAEVIEHVDCDEADEDHTDTTIAGGIITPVARNIVVNAEMGTTDNLDEITAGYDGQRITLSPASGDTITVRDMQTPTTGKAINLAGTGNFQMNDPDDNLELKYNSSTMNWAQVGRSAA